MVFCYNCAFVRSWSDCFGGVYYRCKRAKVVSDSPNAIQRSITRETNQEKNKNNDCPNHCHRRWYELLWANTNG